MRWLALALLLLAAPAEAQVYTSPPNLASPGPIGGTTPSTGAFTTVSGSANAGTPGTGVTAVENGDGTAHITTLTISTTLPNIPGGASLGVGDLLYTFPSGAVSVDVSYMSMAITQTTGHINANTPNVGLGTVIASGVVSVLSGTATFQNIITGSNAANCTGTATVSAVAPTAGSPFIILTAAAHTIFFNAAAAWAASGDPAALLTGTVVLKWNFLH